MIKIQIIGNVGKDATLNEFNGKKAINFSVAHNENFKNSTGVEVSRTLWINCVIWRENGQSTAICDFLKAGTKVFIEGKPSIKTYKNNVGETIANIDCKVDFVELIGVLKAKENPESTEQPENANSFESKDLPF